MPLVGPQVANGLKGEAGICDLLLAPKGCRGLDPSGCPPVALIFSCVAIADVLTYNGFLCILNGVRRRFNILSSSESSEVVSPLSLRRSSNRHCNGYSSWSSNISLQRHSNVGFEKSFLVPVAKLVVG
eukprot:Gb_17827 [translate_table: standard]